MEYIILRTLKVVTAALKSLKNPLMNLLIRKHQLRYKTISDDNSN